MVINALALFGTPLYNRLSKNKYQLNTCKCILNEERTISENELSGKSNNNTDKLKFLSPLILIHDYVCNMSQVTRCL